MDNIWIAAVIALVTGVVGLMLANYINKPVKAFAVRAALVSQGELDESAPLPATYKELERANEALVSEIRQRKRSENEYGLSFDLASRGMVQIAPGSWQLLRVNDRFAELVGYDAEELLQMKLTDLIHPEDMSTLPSIAAEESEESAVNLETRCIRKDGAVIWAKINAIMIRDENGVAQHAVATIDDVTANKLAEAQIQKLNRDLSQIARGELLGQMTAGLAHELNQPLTAITQNVDAALLTVSEQSEGAEELVDILNDVDQQAHRAGDIIKALRSFARKDEQLADSFDIRELLSQSLRLLQPEANDNGVRISVDAGDLPPVRAIRVQTAQVIMNLVHNAIEALASSDPPEKHIDIVARVSGEHVQVSVEDTGPGVDPALKLFSQFETTKTEGMGLGLSICRSIIETGGGKLWYEQAAGGGARFCFTIPATGV